MATENLQIPDIAASQNQKEVTANAAHNLLDRAMNNNVAKAITVATSFTTTEARENFVIELTGTPGAPLNIDMPDTNNRTLAVVNNTDDVMTIRNSAAGGTGQPVLAVGEASIFHYDGVNFLDFSALALTVATWTGLTDTPSTYTGESGRHPQVNIGETALEYVGSAAKRNVIAATTGDSALATTFENGDIIDGVTLVTGDRILIKNQTNGEENGIYIVEATGAPTRAEDFDDALDMEESPVLIPVLEGTANGATVWMHTTTGAIVVDTTPLTFVNVADTATFTGLTDTPSALTGESGTRLTPNNAETALIFVGTDFKTPVVAATTAAQVLADDFENGDTIDGVTLATGDRVLIKNQAAGADNGIYIVEATGAPTRADDFDDDKDAVLGCLVPVNEGTANAQTIWQLSNTTAVTIGSTAQTWVQTGGTSTTRWVEATVQTTNDTTTDIALIPLASGEAKAVRGFGIGTLSGSTRTLAFQFFAAGKNNGGTSAELAADVITQLDNTAGDYVFTIDVDDTGDDIRLRVNGHTAETVDWRVQYEVITEDNT